MFSILWCQTGSIFTICFSLLSLKHNKIPLIALFSHFQCQILISFHRATVSEQQIAPTEELVACCACVLMSIIRDQNCYQCSGVCGICDRPSKNRIKNTDFANRLCLLWIMPYSIFFNLYIADRRKAVKNETLKTIRSRC